MRSKGGQSVTWHLLLPSLVPIIVLSVIPLASAIYLGFTDYALGTQKAHFNGLQNYIYMLSDYQFWDSFRIGAVWTITVTAGEVVLGLALALLLNAGLPLQSLARVLVLIPWAMPPVVKGLMWRLIFHPDAGILNHTLSAIGLLSQSVNWLNDFTSALPSVIIVGIWNGLPQAAIVLLAGLQTIPGELREAAALDGASSSLQFRHITLPLLIPVIIAISSLEFMWNFNSFGLVYVLTEGGPAGMTRLPMLFAYEEGYRYGSLGYAAALGNVMVVIVGFFLVLFVRNRYLSSSGRQ